MDGFIHRVCRKIHNIINVYSRYTTRNQSINQPTNQSINQSINQSWSTLRYTWYPPFFGPKQSPKIGDSRNWWQIASLSFWGLLCFLLCFQFPVKMFPKTNLWSQQTPRVACATGVQLEMFRGHFPRLRNARNADGWDLFLRAATRRGATQIWKHAKCQQHMMFVRWKKHCILQHDFWYVVILF